MKAFQGFPAKMDFTPVPNLFLNRLMPQIEDMAELKTTLFIIMSIYTKKGYPRFVSFGELLGNVSLAGSLKQSAKPADCITSAALTLSSSITFSLCRETAGMKTGYRKSAIYPAP